MAMEKIPSHQDSDGRAGWNIHALAASWRKIVSVILITFVVSAMGGAGTMILKTVMPKYETSADVAIIRTGGAVAMDKRFDATTGTNTRRFNRVEHVTARRAALIGFVHSGDLAKRVVERLGGLLKGYEHPVDQLLQDVSAELVTIGAFSRMNQSDLIRITVDADSPERAAAIADAWADEYVIFVNRLYEAVSQPVIAKVRDEVEKTEQAYIRSQDMLETFLANSKISYMTHLIDTNIETIDKFKTVRQTTISTLSSISINSDIQLLDQYHVRKQKLVELLHSAQGLLLQIEKGGDAGTDSNALAIRMLKLQTYTTKAIFPESLELEIAAPIGKQIKNTEEQIADVKSLIVSLEQRIADTELSITSGISALSRLLVGDHLTSENPEKNQDNIQIGANDHVLHDLNNYILNGDRALRQLVINLELQNQSLRKQIEAENFEIHNLTQKRDLLRSGLEALQNEQIELQLATAATSSEVRFASSAVTPQRSAWPSPVLVAAACGTIVLPIAVFLVFFLYPWGYPGLLSKNTEKPEQT